MRPLDIVRLARHEEGESVLSTYGHALPTRRDETFAKVGCRIYGQIR
jgi:hypothetical protein